MVLLITKILQNDTHHIFECNVLSNFIAYLLDVECTGS